MGITCSNQYCQQKKIKKMIGDQSFQAINSMKSQAQKHKCLFLDSNKKRWLTIEFQINLDKRNEIIDLKDGKIIRLNKMFSISDDEIFSNLEQIKYQEWVGKYNKNRQKIGKWRVQWNGQNLQTVEGYYSGNFINNYKKYYTQKLVKRQVYGKNYFKIIVVWLLYLQKEYIKGEINKECGNILARIIGGGSYTKGQKIGKWVELDEGFYQGNQDSKQVTYSGEYNMQGMKIGKWDSMYCIYGDKEYKQIGGGIYEEDGNQKKIGKWVELDERFEQITYNGEYNMQGMKIGRWDSRFCKKEEREYKQIGGGSYDQDGNQKKIGKWVELDERFEFLKQITYNGEYNMQGMKIGQWDIMYCIYGEYKQIGGGQYDQEGNQKKIGKWVELDERFEFLKSIAYSGEYNLQGMKIGRWDILSRNFLQTEYKQIGGGQYDQDGNQKKIGKWVELDEGFQLFKQITYNSEYNMQGIKIDNWLQNNLK